MGRDHLGTAEPTLQHWRQCGVRCKAEEWSTPPCNTSQCPIVSSNPVVKDQKWFLQEAIPAEGFCHRSPGRRSDTPSQVVWGSKLCLSLQRKGKLSAADLGEISLLAPKLARGLSEHVSTAYEPGASAISLEKSHANDLMQRGEGWYFARRSRIRPKLLFPLCFPKLLSLIRTKLIVSSSSTL